MKRKVKRLWVVPVLGIALSLGLVSTLVLADEIGGNVSITLSNGAQLDVSIQDPLTCTEFKVPAGTANINVNVDGTAAVGLGDPDATIIYVMDESGSTGGGSGTGCSPILQCEKNFFNNLNTAAINDGSTDLAGVVHYSGGSNIQQTLVAPTSALITMAINAASAGGLTNCGAGLNNATALVTSGANTNGTSIVVFASDGNCNTGPAVGPAAAALGATGAIVHSIAIGSGSSCAGSLSLIPQNGGVCTAVPDPGNLPNIIQNLIGSTLDSLEIAVDAGVFATIPNSQISLPLPKPSIVSVTYGLVMPTIVPNLIPADHTISVRATGTDVLNDMQSVTDTHTIHLLQLTASPANEINDLNVDDTHTVTAAIAGGTGPARDIDFAVSGQNAATATPNAAAINATPAGAPVDFVYTVPQDCASLGTDTITVSTTIALMFDSIDVTKDWIDEVPPEVSCDPTVNPHGNKQPQAPGTGQNEDGFYQLNFEDPNLANCLVTLEVVDGSGFVFPGPFLPGDNIKYTQANGAPQKQKKMGSGSGKAGAVTFHLIGHGDLTITGTDPSGNQASATCLVPQPPK